MADLSILDVDYPLTQDQVEFYRQYAFIKLKNVLPAEVVAYFDDVITRSVIELNTMHLPIEERDTLNKAFLQVQNLWAKDELVKDLVFSRRLAKIAADLMEVKGVRLYHDQALYKEPSGGLTPWHADQFYWPLSNDNTITAWIPLQATPIGMGPLEFSAKSHTVKGGRDIGIGDDSEDVIGPILESGGFETVVEPFDLGEVSFHAGWCFHRAGPNVTNTPRKVMTTIYMDRDIRLASPVNDNQQIDWDTWMPGAAIGEPVDTPLNPILFSRS